MAFLDDVKKSFDLQHDTRLKPTGYVEPGTYQSPIDDLRDDQLPAGGGRVDMAKLIHEQVRLGSFPATIELSYSLGVLRVFIHTRDRDTGEPIRLHYGESCAEPFFSSERAAAKWVRDVCLRAIAHELDENFLVRGVRIFDPHR